MVQTQAIVLHFWWPEALAQTRHSWAQHGREAEYIIGRRNTESAGGVITNPMSSSHPT